MDALSADEALLLARELPHLRALIYDGLPGLDRDTSRRLALGVLTVAQGHPKLLELADGQAAHPDQLVRDPSRANAAAVLPAIEQVTARQPRWGHTLASVLAVTDPAAASHLASALIRTLTRTKSNEDPLGSAAADLRQLGTAASPPADAPGLCRQVGGIRGTNLPALLAALSPDRDATEQALRDLIAQAEELAAALEEDDGSDTPSG